MTELLFLCKNASEYEMLLIIEPWAHPYKISPQSSVELRQESGKGRYVLEFEFTKNELTIHSTGTVSVWADDQELQPQFG
jgi:hypothetical protein